MRREGVERLVRNRHRRRHRHRRTIVHCVHPENKGGILEKAERDRGRFLQEVFTVEVTYASK